MASFFLIIIHFMEANAKPQYSLIRCDKIDQKYKGKRGDVVNLAFPV